MFRVWGLGFRSAQKCVDPWVFRVWGLRFKEYDTGRNLQVSSLEDTLVTCSPFVGFRDKD